MESLYTSLDELGVPESIVEIIVGYDGDPFGEQRWMDSGRILQKKHEQEIKEHNDREIQISEMRYVHHQTELQKKAKRRLNMNSPVDDYWSAKERHDNVCTAYPDDKPMKDRAYELFLKFRKQRYQQMWERLTAKLSRDPDRECYNDPYKIGWVDIIPSQDHRSKEESSYDSLRKQAQEECVISYEPYSHGNNIHSIEFPEPLYLSELEPYLIINIPHEKGLITTTIESLKDMFDMSEITITLTNNPDDQTWDFNTDDLIEQMYDEESG